MAHTPGPWTAPSAGVYSVATDECVAEVQPLVCPRLLTYGGSRNREMADNALLIEQAPELLRIVRMVVDGYDEPGGRIVELARAVELARKALMRIDNTACIPEAMEA